MPKNMKSVMVFNPKDSEEETATAFIQWLRNNKRSAVIDRNVPNVEETRKLLSRYNK